MKLPDLGATYRLERSSQKRMILCWRYTKCPESSSLKAHHCFHSRCLTEVLAIWNRPPIPAGALAAHRSTGGSALINMQHMKHLRGRHQCVMLVVQEALQLPINFKVSMPINGKGTFIKHCSVDLSSQLNHGCYPK